MVTFGETAVGGFPGLACHRRTTAFGVSNIAVQNCPALDDPATTWLLLPSAASSTFRAATSQPRTFPSHDAMATFTSVGFAPVCQAVNPGVRRGDFVSILISASETSA